MLCDRCHAIFEGALLYNRWRGHHKSIANLYDAVQQKCYICERMWESLVKEYGYNHDGIDETKYNTIPYDEQESLMLQDVRSSINHTVLERSLRPHTASEADV